jgi:PAS domain S-box-containing protein
LRRLGAWTPEFLVDGKIEVEYLMDRNLELPKRESKMPAVARATERKPVSVLRYKHLFEAALDGILILDAVTFEITDVNPFMLTLLGYSREEFLGKEVWEIGLFGDKGASQAAFRKLQDIGYLRYKDLPLETRNGSRRDVEFVSNAYDEDGRQVIQCNIRDNTERRREEVVRDRLAAIVKSTDDAIVSTDLDGTITTWNSAAEKMFGHLASEILGKRWSLLIPSDRDGEEGKILNMIMRGETLKHFETQRIGKHAKLIDVSLTISPIFNDDGKIVGSSKIARDISELKRANNEIRQLNANLEQRVADRTAQLEAANKELESFSYSVSHDLRAPLRHINGFSGALLEDYNDILDETGKGYLRQVCEASQEMARLIDDVLQLARVTRSKLIPETVDLSEMANSIIADLRSGDPKRAVTVDIADGLSARGDRSLMHILLTNLLGNAWKFTSKTKRAEITFDEQQIEGKTVFFVRDNGAGFDMKFSDKLFGAFQRLHGTDEFEGTGIGLATVQRVINRHGGLVWAEGVIDAGATFYFMFSSVKEPDLED